MNFFKDKIIIPDKDNLFIEENVKNGSAGFIKQLH